MMLAVEMAETWGEHASLWAIRFAMLSMVIVFAMQLSGAREVSNKVRTVWLVGAICALLHSVGALVAFHAGSHQEAFESTAQQTEELLGIAVGFGLYVNYLFVLVWLSDALCRWLRKDFYTSLPFWYRWAVYAFLSFIAVNGTIVFKGGWIRWIGLGAIVYLVVIWGLQMRKSPR